MNPYRDPIPGERGDQNPLRRPAIAIFLSLVTAGVVRLAMTFVVNPSAISKTAWSYAIVSICAVAILVWKVIYARASTTAGSPTRSRGRWPSSTLRSPAPGLR